MTVIAGDGRTLMPGLIDAHVHMVMSTLPIALMMTSDPNYSMLRTGKAATDMLMRGFTSVRDLGGPTFGLKRAIDEGFVAGPRTGQAAPLFLRLLAMGISEPSLICPSRTMRLLTLRNGSASRPLPMVFLRFCVEPVNS